MYAQAGGQDGYVAPTGATLTAWDQFVEAMLVAGVAPYPFDYAVAIVEQLGDVNAAPLIGPLLHSVPLDAGEQLDAVCDVAAITYFKGDSTSWMAFQAAAGPATTLASGAGAALANPSSCQSAHAAHAAPARYRATDSSCARLPSHSATSARFCRTSRSIPGYAATASSTLRSRPD